MKVNVIIACGGVGSRTGLNFNKLLYKINGKPIIRKTLDKFINIDCISKIILAVNPNDEKIFHEITSEADSVFLCYGGQTRTESIKNAMELLEEDCDIVCIHDGARPYVTSEIIYDSINSAYSYGSGVSAYNATDTIAIADNNTITECLNRDRCYIIGTPQSFTKSEIVKAYRQIKENDNFTDDSSVYAKYIKPPTLSLGSSVNKKITFKEDLTEKAYVGVGYDTHKLVSDRKLILGGIEIPHYLGLLGHSDADVLIHAIMDALLCACGERDIGVQFPDSDNQYKDIDSSLLLSKVCMIIREKHYDINNVSAVIMCEKPKLAGYIPDMIRKLSTVMNIDYHKISISATTTEGLGFIGREEGIASQAVVSCYKIYGE